MYRLGLRSVILTWFKANPTADGVGEVRNGGLIKFGREPVREMNRLGMVIDVAQCAPRSLMDAVELSKHPVIASHCDPCGFALSIAAPGVRPRTAYATNPDQSGRRGLG